MLYEIDNLPPEKVQSVDLEELVNWFTEKYRLTTPALDEGRKDVVHNVLRAGESRVLFGVIIPYQGDGNLLHCRTPVPNTVGGGIQWHSDKLEFRFVLNRPDKDELMVQLNAKLERIKQGIAKVNEEVVRFNDELQSLARGRLRVKLDQVKEFYSFTDALPALGFQLKTRDDGSEQVIIPVTLKPFPVSNKSAPGQPPDLSLTLENLDEVIRRIDAMIHVMERSPRDFAHMGEEALRNILLFGLNGIFYGGATGETFNGEGKTDILIRVQDRNIFIAECLIWDGQEHFRKKLDDQLFQYATWRDSQLVAIVFNQQKNFTGVIEKMRKAVREHDQYVRELEYPHESGIRCVFRRDDDAQKHFFLTALAYNVPTPASLPAASNPMGKPLRSHTQ
jgi:hypothetical protein